MSFKSTNITHAAIIAAVYAALTIILMPIGYGYLQIRVAEALTVLPALTPAAIPGLFLGCVLANLIGPYGIVDAALGGFATLLAAILTYLLRNKPNLAPLPPVIINGLVIGLMLRYIYGLPIPALFCIVSVALGEAVACYFIGWPLLKYLRKRKDIF